LEAEERFLTLNIQQMVGSILQQCLPLVSILVFSVNIEVIVIASIAARLVSVAWNGIAAMRSIKTTDGSAVRVGLLWPLLKYGGNVTVTNVIGPLLVSLDQFVIAALLGARSVAHYIVPFNLAMKALILPAALSRALFPRLSNLHGEEASALAEKASLTLAGMTALFCVPAILLSDVGLTLWLGPTFAAATRPVAQLLFVGTWINGIAVVPFALLQGQGRPDITAKFHVLELVPFVGTLWLLIHTFGLTGAAIAWCLRVAVDAVLMFWASGIRFRHFQELLPSGFCVVSAWLVAAFLRPGPLLAILMALLAAGGMALWLVARNPTLRAWIAPIERYLRLENRP
jgi:O-antigen/teichoic acid export membrane protein